METNYIPEFLALAEYGSSYVAAEKLFVSQSTLLRHVQSIEDEFGMPLFERTRKGFILNREGQIFLPYARQIATLKNNCYNMLHVEESENDIVRVCAEGKIIDLMIDFRKKYPAYFIDYYKVGNVEDALYEGKIDVAFMTNLSPRHADNFEMIHYVKEEVLVLVYDDHPLAQQEAATMEQLHGEKFVVLTDDVVLGDGFYNRFSKDNSRPTVVASVPNGNDLIRMVREQIGIALIHGHRDMIPPAAGLKVLQLQPAMEYEMNIYFRNDAPLNKASEMFVTFARRWITEHKDLNQSLIE